MLREPSPFRALDVSLDTLPRQYTGAMWEHDAWGDEPETATLFLQHTAVPRDAQLMGLDRNTEEGALVAMAGSLSPAKLSHRIIAWLLLLAFAVPHVLALLQEIF